MRFNVTHLQNCDLAIFPKIESGSFSPDEGVELKKTDQLKKDLEKLFRNQRLGVLATQNDGQPYSSLVAFTPSKDLRWLYFATTRSTRKYAYLSRDPRVSMLIDNRSNEASDFKLAMAVTATGTAEEVQKSEREGLKTEYLSKHPYLKEFVEAPTCAIIRVEVKTYFMVTQFQNVVEIHME